MTTRPQTIVADTLLESFYAPGRGGDVLPPVDQRIQAFLDAYLSGLEVSVPRLPSRTLVLDRAGLARELSLPRDSDTFQSPYLSSYRTQQGVLHNPKSDRRTTQGVFHIAEDGFPVPGDKLAVPRIAYAKLLEVALQPPEAVQVLPYTAQAPQPVKTFVSLLLRPLVCPATDRDPERRMEVRFFAPGTLISNLDFVEGIFGNGGNPSLPENDAALDVAHWTGHTGCVILAPHLLGLRKKDLGLPAWDKATERQKQDGMAWKNENEFYNNGQAFKITARDSRGVMVTIIADNYYGYCKKEVKTQISFAANLFGQAEEEHAGGALAYPTYVLGNDFYADRSFVLKKISFEEAMAYLGDRVEIRRERFGIDRRYRDIFYVPENAQFHVAQGTVSWDWSGGRYELPLRAGDVWVLPSGYKIRLQKQLGGQRWRLVGSRPDGTFCHKPCTVSGGGKSEISKPITPMIQKSPVIVKEFHKDLDQVEEILRKDYSRIYRIPQPWDRGVRPLLSPERSLGSVVKLFTPSSDYTDDYNAWLRQLPQTIRQLVFVVKRYARPEWGDRWRDHFSVDRVNGYPGHELKFENQKLQADYLRVGFDPEDGTWRLHKLRPDFSPADKVQMEDDITVTTVLPRERVSGLNPQHPHPSVKLVANCESLLFQRPDDAIHRGFDAQAELDLASEGTFLSNFEPLSAAQARRMVEHTAEFDRYTESMKTLLRSFVDRPTAAWVAASDQPRLVDGKPTKNPRYLQKRPDVVHHRDTYVAEIGERLNRGIASGDPAHAPVRAVLAGRRCNPPQPSIQLPALAVYSPIHYQELPELMMDFLTSITGKSPSTTGFGSEGALTKGPFNAMPPVIDMNNAIVSAILTGYAGFSSAAGHIGPRFQVDHDISMIVPEVWCRMLVAERNPAFLIAEGYLEKVNDFESGGRRIQASRLGYRITSRFVERFFARIFETPERIFPEEMLRPEKQGLDIFVEGVNSIVEAQTRAAQAYFRDGSVEAACPPLKAILHIMTQGSFEGKTLDHPEVRRLFTREAMLASDWYRRRLDTKQTRDIALWKRHLETAQIADHAQAAALARTTLARVSDPSYQQELVGTLGADPFPG